MSVTEWKSSVIWGMAVEMMRRSCHGGQFGGVREKDRWTYQGDEKHADENGRHEQEERPSLGILDVLSRGRPRRLQALGSHLVVVVHLGSGHFLVFGGGHCGDSPFILGLLLSRKHGSC